MRPSHLGGRVTHCTRLSLRPVPAHICQEQKRHKIPSLQLGTVNLARGKSCQSECPHYK